MTRQLGLTLLFVSAASGQPAAFEAADVRAVHANLANFNVFMSGPIVRSGRYEIRTATMVDLISTAYGLDQDRSWAVRRGWKWIATT